MKFYNVQLLVGIEDEVKDLGKVIIQEGVGGYKEAISKIPVKIMRYHDNKDERFYEEEIMQYGFVFVIHEDSLVEKNYAKREEVASYLEHLEEVPFHQFLKEHQYVYGTDHKPIQKMIKNYKRGK